MYQQEEIQFSFVLYEINFCCCLPLFFVVLWWFGVGFFCFVFLVFEFFCIFTLGRLGVQSTEVCKFATKVHRERLLSVSTWRGGRICGKE